MKIALIWPKGFNIEHVMPLSLGYLKSNIDNTKHEVKIFDCALHNLDSDSPLLQKMIREFSPQLIGISSWSVMFPEAMCILEKAKLINENVITLMGGLHATFYSHEVMKNKNVDFVLRGEAELSFAQFIDEIEKENRDFSKVDGLTYRSSNGDVINNEIVLQENLDNIKIPDYDAIRLQEYIKWGYRYMSGDKFNAPIWITRGCPYCCDYCSAPLMNGKTIRRHSIEYVVKWVEFLYYEKHIRRVNIIDDNFTFDIQYAKDFCREIIKLNLKDLHLGTPNGVRIQRIDKELLMLMKEAGWQYIVVAPESGSVKTLEKMKKKLDLAILPKKIEEIKSAGLNVLGFFMVGYPGENRMDIEETVKLIRRCRFDFFYLFNFQPLPGTPVYENLVEKKEIAPDFLPTAYTSGKTAYITETLKDFNFPFLRLREYLYLIITNPISLLYILTHHNHRFVAGKIFSNIKNMFNMKMQKDSQKM